MKITCTGSVTVVLIFEGSSEYEMPRQYRHAVGNRDVMIFGQSAKISLNLQVECTQIASKVITSHDLFAFRATKLRIAAESLVVLESNSQHSA